MHWIDWLIMSLPLLICTAIALYTRRYTRSVADFMAGGRNAGRFLVCTARSEQGAGAVVFVSAFQVFAISGFTLNWWNQMPVPLSLILSITGFVIYRYRQTRAMTLAQFFEMRYSRKFRLFTGVLAVFAGCVNFGIIPVVGARFMTSFLGLPQSTHVNAYLFSCDAPTYLILMACFLATCTIVTTMGGQITVLLTDCAEGMISQVFFVLIAVALLFTFFHWENTRAVLLDTRPGYSLVNPFDSSKLKDFNVWYVVMAMFLNMYGSIGWQNGHAFNSSSSSPHESRMAGILSRWRGFASAAMVTLLAVAALTYLKSPDGAAAVQQSASKLADPSEINQMRIPIALSHLLPIGVKGMLLSICLMGIIAGDSIHLHSWGSILIQDVILPLRKKPLSTAGHLRLLRLSVVGVAIWAFLFGWLFPQTEFIAIWFAATVAIFTGGAGACIIGGLYWKRGTTAGAWAAMLLGSILTVLGISLRIYYQRVLGRDFPLNGQQLSCVAAGIALTSYVVVSLLTCRTPHNMDKLLHRGRYALESDRSQAKESTARQANWFYRMLGINSEFSRADRWVTISISAWSMFWVLVFAIGSLAYLVWPWSDSAWATYWLVTGIFMPLVIGVVTTIWFTWGCSHDIVAFFRRLREEIVDLNDDGSVPQLEAREHLEIATGERTETRAAAMPAGEDAQQVPQQFQGSR